MRIGTRRGGIALLVTRGKGWCDQGKTTIRLKITVFH